MIGRIIDVILRRHYVKTKVCLKMKVFSKVDLYESGAIGPVAFVIDVLLLYCLEKVIMQKVCIL